MKSSYSFIIVSLNRLLNKAMSPPIDHVAATQRVSRWYIPHENGVVVALALLLPLAAVNH